MRSASTRQQNVILQALRVCNSSQQAIQPAIQPASSMSEIECSYPKPILTYHLLHEGFFFYFLFYFILFYFILNNNF
jgi:hypothetical protein